MKRKTGIDRIRERLGLADDGEGDDMGGPGSGRKQQSLEDLIAKGTYRKDRHGPLSQLGPVIMPALADEPPEQLNEFGRAEWARLYPMVSKSGLLTDGERTIFFGYCFWSGIFTEAAGHIKDAGMWKPPKKPAEGEKAGADETEKCTKWYRVSAEAWGHMARGAALLGLTPVDRSRVIKAGKGDKPKLPATRQKTALDAMGPLKLHGGA